MGGNLLKTWGLEEKRLNRDDFFRIERRIVELVKSWYPSGGVEIYPIESYRSKETFGDLDIVIGLNYIDPVYLVSKVQESAPHYCLNGRVLSFPYDGFQVDLILAYLEGTDNSRAVMARDYFNYNDASNLVGIMASNMGLSYGDKGLYLAVSERHLGRDNDNLVVNVELTHDAETALKFMGMNWIKWQEGFNTLPDIYEWISNSMWFNKDVYLLENANHKHRLRNRKRPTYQAFQEWLKTYNPPDRYFFHKDASFYFNDIIGRFPHVIPQIEQARMELVHRDVVRQKYNGLLVSDLTGYRGQELGAFMLFLSGNLVTHQQLLYMSPAKVTEWIHKWKEVYEARAPHYPFIRLDQLMYSNFKDGGDITLRGPINSVSMMNDSIELGE